MGEREAVLIFTAMFPCWRNRATEVDKDGNGRNKDRARQAVWGGAKRGRWGHEESHGQCPGQYSGEVWLQKSPCPAIVLGAQSEKRCEEGQAPRHQKQQVLPGPDLCLHFPKATPSWSLSCYIQKYVSWILRIKKEGTETGM